MATQTEQTVIDEKAKLDFSQSMSYGDYLQIDTKLEQERLELSAKRLDLSRLRSELGRAEASALALSDLDHQLQQIETRRREEQLAYLTAQLAGDES